MSGRVGGRCRARVGPPHPPPAKKFFAPQHPILGCRAQQILQVGGGGTYPGPTPTTYPARHLAPIPPDPCARRQLGVKFFFSRKKGNFFLPPAVKIYIKKIASGGKKCFFSVKKMCIKKKLLVAWYIKCRAKLYSGRH